MRDICNCNITPGNGQLIRADGWLAIAMLLASEDDGFQALIAPVHVSTLTGTEEWEFVMRDHHFSRRLPSVTDGRYVPAPSAVA